MSKKLSKEEKALILSEYQKNRNITHIAKLLIDIFGKDKSYKNIEKVRKRISRFLIREKLSESSKILENSFEFKKAKARKHDKSKKYYLITWEQNDTPLFKPFWEKLLMYKEFLDAELFVILGRYKNPTSIFTDRKHERWNLETRPYHDANRHDLHKYLSVLSDIKISPTRKYPLTGLSGLAVGKSIVVGHPKQHLVTEPVLNGYPNKMLFTTGAVTLPNYTDSGIGKISEGAHKFGFVIVEIKDDEVFYIRQVEASPIDGSFIDLKYYVSEDGVKEINKALAIVTGDIHYYSMDETIDKINTRLAEYFNVDYWVMHDVFDGATVNRHIKDNPFEKYKNFKEDKFLIEKEMKETADWIETKLKYNPVIVYSNHDDRLDRALLEDWRKDVYNSTFYLKYSLLKLEGKIDKGVFAYYLDQRFEDHVITLKPNDSFKIGKYECGLHGDNGINGAKASPISMRKLNIPMVLAHTHTPYRADDVFYVGTSSKKNLGYNEKGASTWQHSTVIIHVNNTAQHILPIKGGFTTFDI